MPLNAFLRRRLSWVLTSRTPNDQPIPARVEVHTLVLAVLLPGSAYATQHFDQPMFFALNSCAFAALLLGDLRAHEMFVTGMDVGRRELVAEMVSAWAQGHLDPIEYVHREIWLDSDEIKQARQDVRRSARGRPWPSD